MISLMVHATKRQQVINLVQTMPVVRPKDLKEHGLPKDYLYVLAREGLIERIGRGLYQWPGKDLGRLSLWLGLVSSPLKLSALCYLHLTTTI